MQFFEMASPEVIAEDFGGEIVAIHLESGRYYSLRGLAGAIWKDMNAGYALETISDALAKTDEALATASRSFVEELKAENLVRPRSAADTPVALPMSVTAVRADTEMPRLEAFDDMSDLIKADPIHEVNEGLGWPVRRDA